MMRERDGIRCEDAKNLFFDTYPQQPKDPLVARYNPEKCVDLPAGAQSEETMQVTSTVSLEPCKSET